MADWDTDSPRLRRNLINVLRDVRNRALRRDTPAVADARRWHRGSMAGLDVPDKKYVGRFRGEVGLKTARVWVGRREGTAPSDVARELATFERTLQRVVSALDARCPPEQELDPDALAAVIDVCAWTHAEWIRIHPFANGNGRIARIWANAILMRYGLPPVVTLRPRPDGGYGLAGAAAMDGNWTPTAALFRRMLDDALTEGRL